MAKHLIIKFTYSNAKVNMVSQNFNMGLPTAPEVIPDTIKFNCIMSIDSLLPKSFPN